MSDFSTKRTKPTAAEYLAATDTELLDRLNNSSNESEAPFVQAVIAVRTAENQRKTNESLVKETRRLVWATILVCFFTILAPIASPYFSNPSPHHQSNCAH